MSDEAFTGDMAELNQESERWEVPLPIAVPVNIDGPVQVHMLPSVSAGSRSWDVTTTPQRIANRDPRRRSVTLIALTENVYLGPTQSECQASTAALWPEMVPLVLTHGDAVYVRSATGTTVVSAIVENWAS